MPKWWDVYSYWRRLTGWWHNWCPDGCVPTAVVTPSCDSCRSWPLASTTDSPPVPLPVALVLCFCCTGTRLHLPLHPLHPLLCNSAFYELCPVLLYVYHKYSIFYLLLLFECLSIFNSGYYPCIYSSLTSIHS